MNVFRCDVCQVDHPAAEGLARIMIRVDLPASLLVVPAIPPAGVFLGDQKAPAKLVVELDLCKTNDACKAAGIHQVIREVARQCSVAAGIPDMVTS